jgi:hypothetical protein
MVTVFLAIALLVALMGLGLEIGITSWNIRRANRYRRRGSAAEHAKECAVSERQNIQEQMNSLDDYAGKISWLLNFLYNRYDKFSDLEKEINEGLKDVSGGTPIGEADDRHKDLKKALKLVRVTVQVSGQMESLIDSVAAQLDRIMEDLRDEDEESESDVFEKPSVETSNPESPNSPEAEPA